jgi:hypothetical protein
MSALTILLTLWTTLAIGAILFIRGATTRVQPPAKLAQPVAVRLSVAE